MKSEPRLTFNKTSNQKSKEHIHLVTVGYTTEHILVGLKHISPDKVYLLYTLDPHRKEDAEKVKKAVLKAKEMLEEYMGYSTKDFKVNDEKELKKFLKNLPKDAEISINLTGAIKWLALQLYILALSNPHRITHIFYVKFHFNWSVDELPKAILPVSLTPLEREIMEAKATTLAELSEELKRSKPLLTRYLKKLEEMGLLVYEKGVIKRRPIILEPLL